MNHTHSENTPSKQTAPPPSAQPSSSAPASAASSAPAQSSIDIVIGAQKYTLKGDESEEHLREVAEMVRRKLETLRKSNPGIPLQKAAILAAFDFASQAIKGKRQANDYRSTILSKAGQLLEKIEGELQSPS